MHHDFDKVAILGGSSIVSFGKGEITEPIKILLNGRASVNFANEFIPIEKILYKTAKKYLKKLFPLLPNEKIQILNYLNPSSSPGHINNIYF